MLLPAPAKDPDWPYGALLPAGPVHNHNTLFDHKYIGSIRIIPYKQKLYEYPSAMSETSGFCHNLPTPDHIRYRLQKDVLPDLQNVPWPVLLMSFRQSANTGQLPAEYPVLDYPPPTETEALSVSRSYQKIPQTFQRKPEYSRLSVYPQTFPPILSPF